MRAVRGEAERLRSNLLLAEEDLQKERERLTLFQTEMSTVSNEREALEEANSRLKDKFARLEVSEISWFPEQLRYQFVVFAKHTCTQHAWATAPSLHVQSTMQEQVSQNMEAEQELQLENRKLRQQLEETKRSSTKLGQERDELSRAIEERDRDRDTVRKENTQLDERKKQLEKTVDKLNKEVSMNGDDEGQVREKSLWTVYCNQEISMLLILLLRKVCV